jgi:hypothetical protein
MRARLGVSLLALLTVVCMGLACSSSHAPSGRVLQGPEIIVPQDLAGLINMLTLTVYGADNDAGTMLSCDPKTGVVTGDVAKASNLGGTSDFSQTCSGGAAFCTTSPLKIDDSMAFARIFSVVGYEPGMIKIAIGCAQSMLTPGETTDSLSITLVHALTPDKCGDMTIESTETCDDSTAVCSSCQTVEELVSYANPSSGSGTEMGTAGKITNPSFYWGTGSGGPDDVSGAFVGVYSDASINPPNALQITARILDDTLSPPSSSLFNPVVAASSFYVPSGGSFPPSASVNDEKEPSVTGLAGSVYVAFSSDQPVGGSSTPNPFNIYLDTFAETTSLSGAGPCLVSTTQTMHVQSYPSIAAGTGALYAAWVDDTGAVFGNMITPSGSGCGTIGTPAMLGSGIPTSGNVGPKVAAAASGWVVVWENSGSIEVQLINKDGSANGSTTSVGSGSTPAVGSVQAIGDFAVVWATTGGVEMLRYLSNGSPIDGASAVVNTMTTDTVGSPAIAGGGGSQASGFYAVAWIDEPGTTGAAVRARFVSAASGKLTDDSGYLFNNVDGYADDFLVNVPSVDGAMNRHPNPTTPVVAVGGAGGQFIAFGWLDQGATCPNPGLAPAGVPCYGIIARRFPVPLD